MPNPKGNFIERLTHYHQIKLGVIGRKSGQTISNPVWFVLEGGKLYLLPVRGSDTQWYKNVLKNPSIRIDAQGAEAEFRAVPITEATVVKSVIEKFRQKYGVGDVKKYYSKFDVAVESPYTNGSTSWCWKLPILTRRSSWFRPHCEALRRLAVSSHMRKNLTVGESMP
jgi:deazaflavin-dependent oxidoreductase (nitroreductase family)